MFQIKRTIELTTEDWVRLTSDAKRVLIDLLPSWSDVEPTTISVRMRQCSLRSSSNTAADQQQCAMGGFSLRCITGAASSSVRRSDGVKQQIAASAARPRPARTITA